MAHLNSWLTRHMLTCMAAWPDQIPGNDASDTYYEFPRDVQFVVEISAWLRHRNLHGEEGARKVDIVRLAPYGSDFEILAYERPNRLFRTFLASRVLEFVDLNTGEHVDDVVGYLTEVHRRSPRGQVLLTILKLAVEMGVLMTLARASGQTLAALCLTPMFAGFATTPSPPVPVVVRSACQISRLISKCR